MDQIRVIICEWVYCGHPTWNLHLKPNQRMDQRMIVAYLALKEMSAHVIHEDHVSHSNAMLWHTARLRPTFTERVVFILMSISERSKLIGRSIMPLKLPCSPSKKIHLHRCGSSCDEPTSPPQLSTVASCNRLAAQHPIFDGRRMPCQMRKKADRVNLSRRLLGMLEI
jgi:hypothetical protein